MSNSFVVVCCLDMNISLGGWHFAAQHWPYKALHSETMSPYDTRPTCIRRGGSRDLKKRGGGMLLEYCKNRANVYV